MTKLKDKTLCHLVKDHVLKEALGAFGKLVARPTHICTRCGRVCKDKGRLCAPEKLRH